MPVTFVVLSFDQNLVSDKWSVTYCTLASHCTVDVLYAVILYGVLYTYAAMRIYDPMIL